MEEELEKLDQKRKSLFAQLQEVDGSLSGLQGPNQIIGDLKECLEFFKKGFSKAPPAVKRRMSRSVIGEISYKPGRIELAYHLSESRNNNVVSIDRAKNMKKREILGATEPPALPLRAAGSDLSLSFVNLRDGKIGWGGWTRTSEWQNQNLLTYQLVDAPTWIDYELRKLKKSGFQSKQIFKTA